MRIVWEGRELYCHISTKAGYDPVKTLYVCAPDANAASYEDAARFAQTSGWRELAEQDGAVLVLPVVPQGWRKENAELLMQIYRGTRGGFSTQSGKSLYGRGGYLWCWETLIYAAGYEDGACFLGDAVAACPSFFAAAALVNGVPRDYTPGERPSAHWLVENVSADYKILNRELPVCLWLMAREPRETDAAVRYFNRSNGAGEPGREEVFGGVPATVYTAPHGGAAQVRVSVGDFRPVPALAQTIFTQLFERVIRWKNGPDGKLTPFMSRADFYASPRFTLDSVTFDGRSYDYFVHVPQGLTAEQAQGLPLVFSVHGRGEPAWMFAEKNGWDTLADETGAFVLAVPDSPENIWFLERDGGAFAQMIDRLHSRYGIDRERVYLTGFSNGGMMTREAGTRYPQLFAALSPWNAPPAETWPGFPEIGFEMPCFIYLGDSDPITRDKTQTLPEQMLKANRCAAAQTPEGFVPDAVYNGENHYTAARGYAEGGRFDTAVWYDAQGLPRVGVTVMKNMPHGAIRDESRAAWEFLKRYRRPGNGKTVAAVPQTEERASVQQGGASNTEHTKQKEERAK